MLEYRFISQIHNNPWKLTIVLHPCVLQSNCDDRLYQPVRPGLHGDFEHLEVRQPSPQHQEQGDGEPGPGQPADQRSKDRNCSAADGADGVQDSKSTQRAAFKKHTD